MDEKIYDSSRVVDPYSAGITNKALAPGEFYDSLDEKEMKKLERALDAAKIHRKKSQSPNIDDRNRMAERGET